MCGLAGIVLNKNSTDKSVFTGLEKMLNAIRHRGPDDWGMSLYGEMKDPSMGSTKICYENDSGYSLGLGHRRLSIIDLSELARQPMKDHSGNYEIIFNGEIYNYKEIRNILSDQYSFKTQSDTEVLLAGYSIYGKSVLDKLDGMYSFVIWDKAKKELFCARDHVSIKPFYYVNSEQGFFFASEPRALLEGRDQNRVMNHTVASSFILTGICDHNEQTFYKDIKQLPGGHYLIYDVKNSTIKSINRYWNPDTKTKTSPDLQKQYLHTIKDSISKQLRSDVLLGSSLSGGIDSGTIVTLAGEILGEKAGGYSTITYTHPGLKNDESRHAKMIAENAGMKWQPISPSDENIKDEIEKMMFNMGEPFSTLSMYAQFKIMESAHHSGIKVMLDGQGGDEVFLGYPRVAQFIVKEYLRKGNISQAIQELNGLKKNASLSVLSVLAGNILYNTPGLYMKKSLRKYSEFLNRDFLMSYDKELAAGYYAPKSIEEKQFDELTKYCLPRLLKYSDRNSMHFGVESRVPLLGRNVVEFGINLPVNERVKNGWTKYIMRSSMQGKMPSEVLWDNEKKGFSIPQQYWVGILRNTLSNWINETDTGNLFNKTKILQHLKDENAAGDPGLWRIISTICWMRLLNVKPN